QDTSHDDLSLGVDATVEDELGHAARGTPSEEGEVVVAVAHAPLEHQQKNHVNHIFQMHNGDRMLYEDREYYKDLFGPPESSSFTLDEDLRDDIIQTSSEEEWNFIKSVGINAVITVQQYRPICLLNTFMEGGHVAIKTQRGVWYNLVYGAQLGQGNKYETHIIGGREVHKLANGDWKTVETKFERNLCPTKRSAKEDRLFQITKNIGWQDEIKWFKGTFQVKDGAKIPLPSFGIGTSVFMCQITVNKIFMLQDGDGDTKFNFAKEGNSEISENPQGDPFTWAQIYIETVQSVWNSVNTHKMKDSFAHGEKAALETIWTEKGRLI
ncbi:hypothetical protein ACJX0J_032077, partial [Zea mays]